VAPVELPVVEAVGLTKHKGLWVAFAVKVQGDRVLEHEVLGEPESRTTASDRAKIAFAKRFLMVEDLGPKA
jgi:hypothetical protein